MLQTTPDEPVEAEDVPIDWGSLEDAFENTMHGVRSYLHRVTGAVLRVVDGVEDPSMLARLAADPDYLRIEPVGSEEQYGWMERYIETVEDPELRRRLGQAIVGKGAFRRFKDIVFGDRLERERWFAFRGVHLRIIMGAWLRHHHMRAVPRPSPARGRIVDHRDRLHEIADTLGPGDLAALTAFAAFVRARSRGEVG